MHPVKKAILYRGAVIWHNSMRQWQRRKRSGYFGARSSISFIWGEIMARILLRFITRFHKLFKVRINLPAVRSRHCLSTTILRVLAFQENLLYSQNLVPVFESAPLQPRSHILQPAGHAVSHAWQSRQKFISSINALSSGARRQQRLLWDGCVRGGRLLKPCQCIRRTSRQAQSAMHAIHQNRLVRYHCTFEIRESWLLLYIHVIRQKLLHRWTFSILLLCGVERPHNAVSVKRFSGIEYTLRIDRFFILRIISIFAGGVIFSRNARFAKPVPCSPEIVPPSFTAWVKISSNAFRLERFLLRRAHL